jgi:CHAT domain-containing protein
MPPPRVEAFRLIGSTPKIDKLLGSAVALCPTAPLVAESGELEKKDCLRIANYETGDVLGQVEMVGCHTLTFSPNGTRLFAAPGGKGAWKDALVFAAPWGPAPVVHSTRLASLFHGAWVDDETVLLAGTTSYGLPGVALLDVASGAVRLLHAEGQLSGLPQEPARLDIDFGTGTWPEALDEPGLPQEPGRLDIDSAGCSPSGLVAFTFGYGRHMALYQLRQDRQAVDHQTTFAAQYTGNTMLVAAAEDGQTILCAEQHRDWMGLFNRQGRLLTSSAKKRSNAPVYRHGALCLWASQYRGAGEVQVFKVADNQFVPWASRSMNGKEGLDLLVVGDRALLAVEGEDRTSVFELTDFDVLQLAAAEPAQRLAAARTLRRRRFRPAVPELGRLLWDPDPGVQRVAALALADINDPAALPQLIRRSGQDDPWTPWRPPKLFHELTTFDSMELTAAALDCLNRPAVAHRRGAARLLAWFRHLDESEPLCRALSDADAGVRLAAACALAGRDDLRSCAALLGRLNDPDPQVRQWVHNALKHILASNGLWSAADALPGPEPFDVAGFARAAVAAGRVRAFDRDGDPATTFLCGLAGACADHRPLPDLLNAVEALTASPADAADDSPLVVGLAVALVCADVLRRRARWQDAAHVYRHAVTLARRAGAPQVEWRGWDAVAECRERTGDDPGALAACRQAMEVIDRLWFLLLDEDKLRGFFADKAQLYDRAALCALRLGHAAAALEYVEKSKTRYLGDLIARRHSDPQRALAKELQEFWGHLREARPVRVAAGGTVPGTGEVEIIGVGEGSAEEGGATLQPVRLAAFEEACRSSSRLRQQGGVVEAVWRLVPALAALGDGGPREHLEELYQSLREVRDAVRSGSLPLPPADLAECLRRYTEAARAVREAGQGRAGGAPFWAFSEYGAGWVGAIGSATDASEELTLMLEAVLEALNVLLHHEPVLAAPAEGEDAALGGVVFLTRPRREPPAGAGATTVVETTLAQFERTRWRYVTRLGRGDSCSFREVAEPLHGRPDVAHVEFLVSEHGTAAFVIFGSGESVRADVPLAPLRARLEVLAFPELTLSLLRGLLLEGDDSWLGRYWSRGGSGGHAAWLAALDRALGELSGLLLPRLRACLAGTPVRRLVIVPHRALHLVPFGALFTTDAEGRRRYLADDYEVSYAPSATLQQIARERSAGRGSGASLTAVADPRGDLRHAAREVEAVSRLFLDPRVLAGTEAGLDAVRGLRPGTFFHFAGHGVYRWDAPLTSALLLAGSEELALGSLFDEALALPATQLVALSACETGLADARDLADEWLGLAAGFLFTGVSCVVSTLWAVDDRATMLLMSEFYSRLLRARPDAGPVTAERAAKALGEAQAWLRDLPASQVGDEIAARCPGGGPAPGGAAREVGGRPGSSPVAGDERPFAHPYYWAAFTASGA